MKDYRRKDGERRLWYEPHEIETIALDELTRATCLPDQNAPDLTIDLERFLENHLKVQLDQHAALPAEVLGVTYFRRGAAPRIEINRDLTGLAIDEEDALPGDLGRWRATLAHEAAHVLLHRILYELDDMQRGLFAATDTPPEDAKLHRCLKRDISLIGVADWREVQANRGMAALLMPRPLFLGAAQAILADTDRSSPLTAGSARHTALVETLARRFSVSRQATAIRVETLGLLTPAAQPGLRL